MKRKIAWLALPLGLAALMLGVKWRADHPAPTERDLEIRALISDARFVEIQHFRHSAEGGNTYQTNFTKDESNLLADDFYLSPQQYKVNKSNLITAGLNFFNVHFLAVKPKGAGRMHVNISIDAKRRLGYVRFNVFPNENIPTEHIHPATARRWVRFILNHPRIGPELRKRMKL